MSVTIPIEIWIEVLKHLQYDRMTLVQLSLVSRYLRSIAQPLLFHTINDIAQMSKKTYKKYCLCGQIQHRHVLAYIREFTLDDDCRHYKSWSKRTFTSSSNNNNNKKRSSNWITIKWFRSKKSQERKLYESLHPGALLPCMINLTKLCIRTRNRDNLVCILRHCTETVSLVEVYLGYKGRVGECCDWNKEEVKVIEGFVGRQRGLKRLVLSGEVGVMEFLDVSEDIEQVTASWRQLVVILSAKQKSRLESIHIISDPSPANSYSSFSSSTMADIIQPHQCPRLCYIFLSLDDLIGLRFWEEPWKDKLVLLSISSLNRPWSELNHYLTRFSNLKILTLEPITIPAQEALIQIRNLFTKLSKLEMVILVGGLKVIYTRNRRRKKKKQRYEDEDDEVFELDYVKDLVKTCDMDVDLGIW